MGLKQIAEAGYDPAAMPETWQQLIEEIEASAEMRRKRPKRGYSLLATHPAPEQRMVDLRASAKEVTTARSTERGRDRYLGAIGAHRRTLLDDQVKLNDPGASLYILRNLAKDGWNGLLRYYEGEVWRLRGAQRRQRARRPELCRRHRLSRRAARSLARARLPAAEGAAAATRARRRSTAISRSPRGRPTRRWSATRSSQ